jgi:hypothetical protein
LAIRERLIIGAFKFDSDREVVAADCARAIRIGPACHARRMAGYELDQLAVADG